MFSMDDSRPSWEIFKVSRNQTMLQIFLKSFLFSKRIWKKKFSYLEPTSLAEP